MEQGEVAIVAQGDDMGIANDTEVVVVAAGGQQYVEMEDDKLGEEDVPSGRKLKEGFYEVEAIRRRRVRKGKVQYLIKWRGWPESVNTWEPFEHLEQCQDIVEHFEARKTNSGKRKRGASHASVRRKRLSPEYIDVQTEVIPTSSGAACVAAETLLNFPGEPFAVSGQDGNINARVVESAGTGGLALVVASGSKVGSESGPEATGSNKELRADGIKQVDDPALLRISEQDDTSKCEVDTSDATLSIEKAGVSEGNEEHQVHHNCPELEEHTIDETGVRPKRSSSRCTGAKKRKAGAVRRLKESVDLKDKDAEENHLFEEVKKAPDIIRASAVSGSEKMQFQEYRSLLFPTSDITKQAFSSPDRLQKSAQKMAPIVKILKPIKYSSSVNNEKQEVLVLFSTLRSDGKESVVDNKYLRQHFPLLLIDFYEQHLRYTIK